MISGGALTLLLLLVNSPETALLDGCRPLARDLVMLERLDGAEWSGITVSSLGDLAPSPLSPNGCGDSGLVLTWMGRVIEGTCECCTTFVFEPGLAGQESGRLIAVVVKRTSRDSVRVLADVKEMLHTIKRNGRPLVAARIPTALGQEGVREDFDWATADELVQVIARVYKAESRWTAELYASRIQLPR